MICSSLCLLLQIRSLDYQLNDFVSRLLFRNTFYSLTNSPLFSRYRPTHLTLVSSLSEGTCNISLFRILDTQQFFPLSSRWPLHISANTHFAGALSFHETLSFSSSNNLSSSKLGNFLIAFIKKSFLLSLCSFHLLYLFNYLGFHAATPWLDSTCWSQIPIQNVLLSFASDIIVICIWPSTSRNSFFKQSLSLELLCPIVIFVQFCFHWYYSLFQYHIFPFISNSISTFQYYSYPFVLQLLSAKSVKLS